MQPPGVALNIVAPPEKSIRVEGPKTTTEVREKSQGVIDARADEADANRRMMEWADEEEWIKQQQGKIAAVDAQRKADIARYAELERGLLESKKAEEQAARRVQTEQRWKEREKASKITDYWEDRSVPARVFGALMVGLGEIGRSMSGGSQNGAYAILQDAMARDRQIKIDKLKSLDDTYEKALAGDKAAEAEWDRRIQAVRDSEASRIAHIDRQADIIAKKYPASGPAHEKWKAEKQADQFRRMAEEEAVYDRKATEQGPQTSTTTNIGGGQVTGGVFGPGGRFLTTTGDPKKDKELNDLTTPYRDLRQVLSDLKDTYKGNVRLNPLSPEAQRRSELAAEAKTIYNRERAKLGAMAGQDLPIIENATGSGKAVFTIDQTPRLEQAIKVLDRGMVMQFEGRGLPGAEIVPHLTAPAQPAPAAPQAPAATLAPKSGPAPKRDAKAYSEAALWLKKNPNHPKAGEVRAKLKEMREAGN